MASNKSGKDSTWETYFGKPLIPYERADNQLSHETYNLPKSYEGKNKHLEDVLDFMIRKEDEFYTSRLLPWSFTDDLHVQWEIFRFNRTLMDVEPEQGIPRLVTAETERRTDNLLRRGLAFIIEHGFMTTDRGRRHFMMNLQQITDAVHTTAYFGVMHALLSAKQHYKKWRKETDRTAKKPRNLLRHERSSWACVQKTHKGLYVLDAELKHQMKKNNVVPNVWVFPPKMSIYLDMAPTEQTEYRLKGPQAAGNLEDDRTQKGIRWRDTEVFEAATFDIDFVNDDHDLLQRVRQVGEFFVIPAGCKAIKIFSADHDEFKVIEYEDAHKHALNHGYTDTTTVSGGPDRDLATFGGGSKALSGFKSHIGSLIAKKAAQIVLDIAKKEPLKAAAATQFKLRDDKVSKDIQDADAADEGDIPDLADELPNAITKANGDGVFDGAKMTKLTSNFWCCTEEEVEKHLQEIFSYVDEVLPALIAALTSNTTARGKGASKAAWDKIVTLREFFSALYGFAYAKWHADLKEQEGNMSSRGGARDIIIFRPFQTYRMSSAILAAGGRELGETFHGHHDFQLSDDIIRKVHVGHYTHYSKSVVKQPKRYAIAEDVFAQGYVSGEGVEFFSEASLRKACGDGDIGTPDCAESLIAWVVPSGVDATVLDMTGEFSDEHSEYGDCLFSGCGVLKGLLQDCDVNREQTHDDIFLSNQYSDNTLCFRGKQFDLQDVVLRGSTAMEEYVCTSLGHGHWKGLTYSGCMDVREGTIIASEHSQHQVGQRLLH